MANAVGRPREIDREELLRKLLEYIGETEIPILAEFAYKNDINRAQLYELPELSDGIKKLIAKKESALESKALRNEINPTMAIFSLKQLGWKDRQEIEIDSKRPIILPIDPRSFYDPDAKTD